MVSFSAGKKYFPSIDILHPKQRKSFDSITSQISQSQSRMALFGSSYHV